MQLPSIVVTTPGNTIVPLEDRDGTESGRSSPTETTRLVQRSNVAAPPPRLNNLPVETMQEIAGYLTDSPADVTALASTSVNIRAQVWSQAAVARLEQRAASITTFSEVQQLLDPGAPATGTGMPDAIVQLRAQEQVGPLTALARQLPNMSLVHRLQAQRLVRQAVTQLPQDLQAGPMAALQTVLQAPANPVADTIRAAFPRLDRRRETPMQYASRLAGLAASGALPVRMTMTDVAAVTGVSPFQLRRDPDMSVFR